MTALKIQQVGGELGVTLPAEMVERLGLAPGGELFLTEAEGGYTLTTQTAESARQYALGLQVMRDFDATFRELAK